MKRLNYKQAVEEGLDVGWLDMLMFKSGATRLYEVNGHIIQRWQWGNPCSYLLAFTLITYHTFRHGITDALYTYGIIDGDDE